MSEVFQSFTSLHVAVLTVSDTRTVESDSGGQLLRELVESSGMSIASYTIVRDTASEIQHQLNEWLRTDAIDAILVTGGTGISKRDVTIEAVEPLYEKKIEGFGELFRHLSYVEDVGSKAMLSRASAGTIGDKAVFLLPGSRAAIRLAMTKLILPELPHIYFELTKHQQSRV